MERITRHARWVIERNFDASPGQVFSAWADPAVKSRWFSAPDEWAAGRYTLDFRVGGREHAGGGPEGGPVFSYDAIYHEIVPEQRILSTYNMHRDDRLISVSVSTVEFAPNGSGTRMVYTEQGVFVDDEDEPAERERGSNELIDKLAEVLAAERARP